MSISVVQNATWTTGSSGSFSANVTIGNSVILWICDYNTSGTTISTSNPQYNGGSVTGATQLFGVQCSGSTKMYVSIWLLPNVASSGKSVSYTASGGFNDTNSSHYIAEVSGLGASPSLDTASPNPATNSGAAGGSVTSGATGNVASSSGIVVGGIMNNNSLTGPSAPWTDITQPNPYSSAGYQIYASSGSSYTYSGTGTAGEWATGVAVIKSTGSGSPTPSLLMTSFP